MKQTFLLSCVLLFGMSTHAQHAGDLDSSFGNNGMVISGSATNFSYAGVQRNNKIVAVTANTLGDTIQIFRYSTEGNIDQSFAKKGMLKYVYRHTPYSNTILFRLLIQSDDKIVVAGTFYSVLADVFMVRFTKDGIVDSAFGTNGSITYSRSYITTLKDVLPQADDKLLMSVSDTYEGEPGLVESALIRYKTDGQPDSAFGIDGRQNISNLNSGILAQQPNGKIIVARGNYTPRGYVFYRRLSNGNIDAGFGVNGELVMPVNVPGKNSVIDAIALNDIAVQPSGKIVVTGSINWHSAEFKNFNAYVVARATANGTKDTLFSKDGVAPYYYLAETRLEAERVLTQPDGKVVISGFASNYNNGVYRDSGIIVRLQENGKRDSLFGDSGVVINSATAGFSILNIALATDGKIVTVGNIYNSTKKHYYATIVRYLGDNTSKRRDNKTYYTVSNNKIENTTATVKLYPNPTSNVVQIAGIPLQKTSTWLLDMSGNIIKHFTTQGGHLSIPVRQLPAGRYNLRIMDSSGKIQSIFFIKQ